MAGNSLSWLTDMVPGWTSFKGSLHSVCLSVFLLISMILKGRTDIYLPSPASVLGLAQERGPIPLTQEALKCVSVEWQRSQK